MLLNYKNQRIVDKNQRLHLKCGQTRTTMSYEIAHCVAQVIGNIFHSQYVIRVRNYWLVLLSTPCHVFGNMYLVFLTSYQLEEPLPFKNCCIDSSNCNIVHLIIVVRISFVSNHLKFLKDSIQT